MESGWEEKENSERDTEGTTQEVGGELGENGVAKGRQDLEGRFIYQLYNSILRSTGKCSSRYIIIVDWKVYKYCWSTHR